MGPLVPALCWILLSLAPVCRAAPVPPYAAPVYKALFEDLDPSYAQAFLDDQDARARLRAEGGDLEAHCVERAARLADLRETLLAHETAAELHSALKIRLEQADGEPLPFAKAPLRLVEWRDKHAPKAAPGVLEAALEQWPTLSQGQRQWLSSAPRALGEAGWNQLSLAQRDGYIEARSKEALEGFMKVAPKTAQEVQGMRALALEIEQGLSPEKRRLVWDRISRASAFVEGLRRAEAAMGKGDPAVQELLAQARASASLEDGLAAISRLFDKTGVRDREIQAQLPAAPSSSVKSLDQRMLSTMLAQALHDDLSDTEEGRRVNAFYRDHKLNLAIRDLNVGTLGEYNTDGEMSINRRELDDWLKAENLTAADLVKSPGTMKRLAWVLSGTFVHEARHQIQQTWAKDNGVEHWWGQHHEVEAQAAKALFVLENARAEPGYRKFLEENQAVSGIARSCVQLSAQLERDPRSFRRTVEARYYEGLPSIHVAAADKLAKAEQDLQRAKASARAPLLAKQARLLDAYDRTRRRYLSEIAKVEAELRDLDSPKLAASDKASDVPAPSTGRSR